MSAASWHFEVPVAVWSSLVAGGIAVLGVVLTNWHSPQRQRIELDHQAREKEKERQHTLKRDIYVPLLEAASDAIGFVMRVPTMPFEMLTSVNPNPLMEFAKHVSKIHLIAPFDVIEPITRGESHLIKMIGSLIGERVAIQKLSGRLTSLDAEIKGHLIHQNNTQERLNRHVDQGTQNPALLQSLNDAIVASRTTVKNLFATRQALADEKQKLELSLMQQASEQMKQAKTYYLQTIPAIRRELNILADDTRWMDFMESRWKENEQTLRHLYEKFESQILGTTAAESLGGGEGPGKTGGVQGLL